jgi:hypothetical protein
MSKRHDRKTRRRLVAQWQQSGLTARQFADQAGVSSTTFDRWRREVGSSAAFVEVVARDAASPARAVGGGIDPAVEIALPGGVVVRVGHDVDEVLLRRVVRALA